MLDTHYKVLLHKNDALIFFFEFISQSKKIFMNNW